MSSTRDDVEVWVESGSAGVTFYRMDTRRSIDDPSDPVELSSNETVTVGIRIDSGVSAVSTAKLTVHAVLPTTTTPTPSPEPTTRSAGSGGSGGGGTGGSGSSGGGSAPTRTTAPATTAPTPTATPSPTETGQPTTVPTDDGTTVPDDGTATGTAPPDGNETAIPVGTSPPAAQEPPTTGAGTPPDDGDRFELGGISLSLLGALLVALLGLPLALWATGLLRGSPALVVTVDTAGGLRVAPGRGDEDHYATGEDTVTFAFTESEDWDSRGDDAPVRFDGVVTLSNATDDPLVVTPHGEDDALETVRVLAGETPVPADGLRLVGGAEQSLTVEFPAGFDPDDDVTLFFDAEPPAD
ncbi:hypothetical protein [Halosimplex salinum]|uniref:hypothetical protein n=1 Tax=Halosimplex salinum TaxID=1710538 RepID=UPI0013DE0150|nr:hypothetical protein [Halosimplex salinum]